MKRQFVLLTDPKGTLRRGGHTGKHRGGQGAEGVGDKVGKSLCCFFLKEGQGAGGRVSRRRVG